MNVSPSKESILKKIRKALSISTPLPFMQSEGNQSVYQPLKQELEMEFAERFTALQGKFIFCLDETEMLAQLRGLCQQMGWTKIFTREQKLEKYLQGILPPTTEPVELESCDASITFCETLVARTGSIVLSSGDASGRTTSVYAPVHICVAYTSQLVYDLKDAFQRMKEKYGTHLPSMISFATGPSRTADIEKTLVVGVHGPKEVYVFLLDQNP
jgi:L-lactate dehydrogenase complex protein LldG